MSHLRNRPSAPFIAQYNGYCSGCDEKIVGDVDEIVMWKGSAYHNDEDCCHGLVETPDDLTEKPVDRWADE